MHSRIVRIAMLATFPLLSVVYGAVLDTFAFSLIPADGNVSGPPGSTVGWGYSLTNQSVTNWLVTTGLNADSFVFGTATALFDFPDLAPGTTASQSFNPTSGVGLYELMWDASAPADFANFGNFTLSAEWWSGDPLNGGAFIQAAPDSSQAYFAGVSENVVPEPSTFTPLVTITLVILFRLCSIPIHRTIQSAPSIRPAKTI